MEYNPSKVQQLEKFDFFNYDSDNQFAFTKIDNKGKTYFLPVEQVYNNSLASFREYEFTPNNNVPTQPQLTNSYAEFKIDNIGETCVMSKFLLTFNITCVNSTGSGINSSPAISYFEKCEIMRGSNTLTQQPTEMDWIYFYPLLDLDKEKDGDEDITKFLGLDPAHYERGIAFPTGTTVREHTFELHNVLSNLNIPRNLINKHELRFRLHWRKNITSLDSSITFSNVVLHVLCAALTKPRYMTLIKQPWLNYKCVSPMKIELNIPNAIAQTGVYNDTIRGIGDGIYAMAALVYITLGTRKTSTNYNECMKMHAISEIQLTDNLNSSLINNVSYSEQYLQYLTQDLMLPHTDLPSFQKVYIVPFSLGLNDCIRKGNMAGGLFIPPDSKIQFTCTEAGGIPTGSTLNILFLTMGLLTLKDGSLDHQLA